MSQVANKCERRQSAYTKAKIISIAMILCVLLSACSSGKSLRKDMISGLSDVYGDLVYAKDELVFRVSEMDSGKYSVDASFKGTFSPEKYQEVCLYVVSWLSDYSASNKIEVSLLHINWYGEDEKMMWGYHPTPSTGFSEGLLYLYGSGDGDLRQFSNISIDSIAENTAQYDSTNVVSLPNDVPTPEVSLTGIEDGIAYFDVYIPADYDWDNASYDEQVKVALWAVQKCTDLAANKPDVESISILASLADGHRAFIYDGGSVIKMYSNGGKENGIYAIE